MDKPMGQVRQLDVRVNEAGFLRLMTPLPYMNNMSNQLPAWLNPRKNLHTRAKQKGIRLRNLKLIKWPLMRLYDWIFNIYWRDR